MSWSGHIAEQACTPCRRTICCSGGNTLACQDILIDALGGPQTIAVAGNYVVALSDITYNEGNIVATGITGTTFTLPTPGIYEVTWDLEGSITGGLGGGFIGILQNGAQLIVSQQAIVPGAAHAIIYGRTFILQATTPNTTVQLVVINAAAGDTIITAHLVIELIKRL